MGQPRILARRAVLLANGWALLTRLEYGREWELLIYPHGDVTVDEAALLLSVHRDTVRGWIERGEIVPVTYTADGGRTLMIPLRALREFRGPSRSVIARGARRTRRAK